MSFLVVLHLNNTLISAINWTFIGEKAGYKVGKCLRSDQWPQTVHSKPRQQQQHLTRLAVRDRNVLEPDISPR